MDIGEFREKLKTLTAEYIAANGDEVQVMIAILTDKGKLSTSGYGCIRCTIDALNKWVKFKNIQHQPMPQISHSKN